MVRFKDLEVGYNVFTINCKTSEISYLKISEFPSFISDGKTIYLYIIAANLLFGEKLILIRKDKINQSIYFCGKELIVFSDKKLLSYFLDLIYHR